MPLLCFTDRHYVAVTTLPGRPRAGELAAAELHRHRAAQHHGEAPRAAGDHEEVRIL